MGLTALKSRFHGLSETCSEDKRQIMGRPGGITERGVKEEAGGALECLLQTFPLASFAGNEKICHFSF